MRCCRTGPLQSLPMYIEGYYVNKFKYADMVMYPISPTTSIPSTYPMLDPNAAEPDSEDEEGTHYNHAAILATIIVFV